MPGRAYLTVPPEVEIIPSKIDGAGLGVVAKTFIPKYTWLGEYDGITIVPNEEDYISDYTWQVKTDLRSFGRIALDLSDTLAH